MKLLTEDASLVCNHVMGKVELITSQDWVTILGRKILIKNNPEGRPIKGCPLTGPAIKPCTTTFAVREGYSDMISIEGAPICLDTVTGLTDGVPPGTVIYKVSKAGQELVGEIP